MPRYLYPEVAPVRGKRKHVTFLHDFPHIRCKNHRSQYKSYYTRNKRRKLKEKRLPMQKWSVNEGFEEFVKMEAAFSNALMVLPRRERIQMRKASLKARRERSAEIVAGTWRAMLYPKTRAQLTLMGLVNAEGMTPAEKWAAEVTQLIERTERVMEVLREGNLSMRQKVRLAMDVFEDDVPWEGRGGIREYISESSRPVRERRKMHERICGTLERVGWAQAVERRGWEEERSRRFWGMVELCRVLEGLGIGNEEEEKVRERRDAHRRICGMLERVQWAQAAERRRREEMRREEFWMEVELCRVFGRLNMEDEGD